MNESKTTKWQPIENAPLDGQAIFVKLPDGRQVRAKYSSDKWCGFVRQMLMREENIEFCVAFNDINQPTHWKPLREVSND